MGSDSGPSGPSAEQQQQLAESKAKNRRDEQKIAKKQVEGLRSASSEGGLLAEPRAALLTNPPGPSTPQLGSLPIGKVLSKSKRLKKPEAEGQQPLFGGN